MADANSQAGPDNSAADDTGAAPPIPVLAAPPGLTEDSGKKVLRRYMRKVILLLELEVPPKSETLGWRPIARNEIRKALVNRSTGLSEDFFEPLVRAAIYEPDPSHNRWFVEPAINAFGRRRVQMELLAVLRTGTDQERAGAARAWYWTGLPLRQQHLRAGTPAEQMGATTDDAADIVAAWRKTALQEFVGNQNVEVRRCILPMLRLNPASYPPELHALVNAAVEIARSHPDEYIRHRVEIQIHQ